MFVKKCSLRLLTLELKRLVVVFIGLLISSGANLAPTWSILGTSFCIFILLKAFFCKVDLLLIYYCLSVGGHVGCRGWDVPIRRPGPSGPHLSRCSVSRDGFWKECDFVVFGSVWGRTGHFLLLGPVISVTQTLVPCAFPVWLRVGSLAFPSPVASFLDSLEVGQGYPAAKNDGVASDDSLFILNCHSDCLRAHPTASNSCRTLHLITTFSLTGNHLFLFQNQDVRGWELDPPHPATWQSVFQDWGWTSRPLLTGVGGWGGGGGVGPR